MKPSEAVNTMDRLIERWRRIKRELEVQLSNFDPPLSLRAYHGKQETTEETKEHLRRGIAEMDALLKMHDRPGRATAAR
jgi:hypothetical protein